MRAFLVALNQMLAIVLDTPIGVTSGGRVSVFTLPPSSGNARAIIRVGTYNGGSPQIVLSRNVRAGRVRNINNLFSNGCGILGGCDYIEIITTRVRRGAAGVEVDYIEVDGQLVQVTSPTPEPAAWAMMILGFAFTAYRLKALRPRSENSAAVFRAGLAGKQAYSENSACMFASVAQPSFARPSNAANCSSEKRIAFCCGLNFDQAAGTGDHEIRIRLRS